MEEVLESTVIADGDDLLHLGFRLGEWQVRPIEGSMEGPGGTRHLQPKSMDVLLCLAASPNQIVERDDLIKAVWGHTAVSDEPLTRCIHEIRRELNDASDHPTYIRTVPKRGYQLIAPISPGLTPADAAAPSERLTGISALLAPQYRLEWTALALAGMLSMLVAIILMQRQQTPVMQPVIDNSRIAVLPFGTVDEEVPVGQPRLDWLGSGIAEDLLTRLAHVSGIEISPPAVSTQRFDPTQDVLEIGRLLDVHYVLKGTVLRTGNRLHIRARLLDAHTRFRLWGATFDRDSAELFTIQQEIVSEVVRALQRAMLTESGDVAMPLVPTISPTALAPTASIRAYEYFLQARNLLQVADSPGALDQAAVFFTRAIEHDARFAGAYTGLCATIARQLDTGQAQPRPRPAAELLGSYDTVCRKAIELAPDSFAAHLAYGTLYRTTGRLEQALDEFSWVIGRHAQSVSAYLGLGRVYAELELHDKAEEAFLRAIAIRQDDTRGYESYGAYLASRGRYGEMQEIGRRLIQLDPQNVSGYKTLGRAAYFNGQFTAAIAAFREVIRRKPSAAGYIEIGNSLYYLGRYQAAAQTFRLALELDPLEHRMWGRLGDIYSQLEGSSAAGAEAFARARELVAAKLVAQPGDAVDHISLAYYCAALGDARCAVGHSNDALALAPQAPVVHYLHALVQLRLGNRAAAIRAVESALELGYPRTLFRVDPQLLVVRGSPLLAGALIAQAPVVPFQVKPY